MSSKEDLPERLQMLAEYAEGNFHIFVDLLEIACGAQAEPSEGLVNLGTEAFLPFLSMHDPP